MGKGREMIFIFLLLLLPVQAGASDVMSRQQAEKPDSFRVIYVGNNADYNREIRKLRARLDSLEAKLNRAHIDSVCVIKHAGWRYYKLTGEPYWYKGAVYWKHIINFDPEGK